MSFEVFGRICVGGTLENEVARALHGEFLESLGLAASSTGEELFERLRIDTAKHKLHEPDRVRYERAFEAFVDAKWDVDCAFGGLSRDGLLDLRRGYVFVGVRVDQFEIVVSTLGVGATSPERPQWLRKGDLTAGSEMSKSLGPDARKSWEHAARSYQRAARDILRDAIARTRKVPVSKQHEIDWALCRWVVDEAHASAMPRHGRER